MVFNAMQLFTFYKYASGVMRQGIGNNCYVFAPQSKPISYLFKIETLSIFFFFLLGSRLSSEQQFPSVFSSCKFSGGDNTT